MDSIPAMNWVTNPDWTADDKEKARLVYFRRAFQLADIPEQFYLRITAGSRYKLYVNGIFVQFGPAKGDSTLWFVDQVDIASSLRKGKNVLAVSVLCYPTQGEQGNHSLFRFDRPRLFTEGLPAGEWRCTVERGIAFYAEEDGFSPLQIHEKAAPSGNLRDWQEADYNDSTWDKAVICGESDLPALLRPDRLVDRTIPFMERVPHRFTLPFTLVPAFSEVSFVLDAKEEMCAFVSLALSGGQGTKVELLYSECYVTNTGKGNRLDAEHGHLEGYTDYYTVLGAEREVYEPYWFRTFRFLKVMVRTADQPLTLHDFTYEETGYPLEVKTQVRTSDESLHRIWDISLRTLRRCMHETYMDCPFYEQMQYAMDTRSQILYTYAVSADDRLARKAIDQFSRALRPDGLMNCSYPNVNSNVIPGFSIYYILMVYDHMMYFGDWALVERYLPTIHRLLNFFEEHRTPDGLVAKVGGVNGKAPIWSFIDWAEDWLETEGMPTAGLYGPLTMESLLYLLGLERAAELSDYVNDNRAADYRSRADHLRRAIREQCMDGRGMLTDGPGRPELSQHAQVFGILTGTLTMEEGRRNLLHSIEGEGVTQCTVAMCYYLFRALEKTGLYEYSDRYWEIWRRMLADGCTTCVESEGYSRSECHAWGALALYELPSVILGVRPTAPGYSAFEVSPVPGYLRSASGTVHTPLGDVSVAWEKSGDNLHVSVECEQELEKRMSTK